MSAGKIYTAPQGGFSHAAQAALNTGGIKKAGASAYRDTPAFLREVRFNHKVESNRRFAVEEGFRRKSPFFLFLFRLLRGFLSLGLEN
jgi:hypothetical protein